MTPLFKKGNTDDPNNYRPISILPVTVKIFERVVHFQIVDFLYLSGILSSSQSGFRNSHSTETGVICVSHYILEELSKGRYVCLLYTSPSPRDKRQSRMPSSA